MSSTNPPVEPKKEDTQETPPKANTEQEQERELTDDEIRAMPPPSREEILQWLSTETEEDRAALISEAVRRYRAGERSVWDKK